MSKNQFTGTATQPQRNRKICQFNKDQYCMSGRFWTIPKYNSGKNKLILNQVPDLGLRCLQSPLKWTIYITDFNHLIKTIATGCLRNARLFYIIMEY